MEKQPNNKMLHPDLKYKEYNGELMLKVSEYAQLIGKSERIVQRMMANDYFMPGVKKVLGSGHARILVVSKVYVFGPS